MRPHWEMMWSRRWSNWRKQVTGIWCLETHCSFSLVAIEWAVLLYHQWLASGHLRSRAMEPDNCELRPLKPSLLLNCFRHVSQWQSLINKHSALKLRKHPIKFQLCHLFFYMESRFPFYPVSYNLWVIIIFILWWSNGHDLQPLQTDV